MAFWALKSGNFLRLEENYLNTSKETQDNGNATSHEMLQLGACEIAWLLNIMGNKFKTRREWLSKFMKRKNLSPRRKTSQCQKLRTDFTEKVEAFHCHVIRMWKVKSYILLQIVNADQTPVFSDMIKNITFQQRFISCSRQNIRPYITIFIRVICACHFKKK